MNIYAKEGDKVKAIFKDGKIQYGNIETIQITLSQFLAPNPLHP